MACATFVRRILIPIFVLGLAVAHAQTITKVSGDGQLAIQAVLSSNPMVVLVRTPVAIRCQMQKSRGLSPLLGKVA